MRITALALALASAGWATIGVAQRAYDYRYDRSTRASDYARDIFAKPGAYKDIPELRMGRYSVGVGTTLDCGKLDINANLKGEFDQLQTQLKSFIPHTAEDAMKLAQGGAMMATCYAYPTVCAQLRSDFLSMQGNFNLRAQACRAIDQFIDSSAERGAKQLRAEAQAQCVSEKVAGGEISMLAATRMCQEATGLPLRDFQAGLEKRFTTQKQKVLESIVRFAKAERDPATYEMLASLLGEIEVQPDGYWQPLFAKGMLRPSDVAQNFLAASERKACSRGLASIIERTAPPSRSVAEKALDEVIMRRLTAEDVSNLGDLGEEDRRLACAALGRALGQVAATAATSKAEAVLASGLLNTAIPDSLRDEYRTRGGGAFDALKKAVDADQIPPLEEVRGAIGRLARATREKNRVIASGITKGRIENYRRESEAQSDCVDTLSCGE